MRNKTRIISLFLSIIMILSVFNIVPILASAASQDVITTGATPDEVNSDYNYNVLNNGTAEITKYTGLGENINIPSIIDGYTVTSIGGYAFGGNTNLMSVSIPDSVISIGNAAFRGCSNLTSLSIPDSVTNIFGNAFSGTAWYENQQDGLVYAGKVAYNVKGECPAEVIIKDGTLGISEGVFAGSPNLESVIIPDSVIKMGDMAFAGCTSLTDINVSGANQMYASVDGVLFNKDLSELICYPAGKTADSYIIPDSVGKIIDNAFLACTSLKSVTIGNGMTSIGEAAFYHCYSLQNVAIPDTVKSLENYAFNSCSSLTSIRIPDSVVSIGNYTFWKCSALKDIDFGSGVRRIRYYAFDNTAWYNDQPDGLVYAGKVAYRYKGECPSTVVIKDGTQGIASGAFNGCASLADVTVPDSVTVSGVAFVNTAWYNNQPDGLVYAGKAAYQYKGECPSEVVIRDGTLSISDYAFQNCKALTSVSIPDSVTDIGAYSFSNCTSLTSFTVPDSVISIGEWAFRGCDSLTGMTVPDTVAVIENKALGYTESGEKRDDFVIYGYSDTVAENYANKNGFSFVEIGQELTEPTISFTPKYSYEYVEKYNGYYETEDSDEFIYYAPPFNNGDKLSIIYPDERGTIDYYYDDKYESSFMNENGDKIFPWDIVRSRGYGWTVGGENTFTITYENMTTSVPVALVKPENASIKYIPSKPYELVENREGYMAGDYFRYYTPDFVSGDKIIVDYGNEAIIYTYSSKKIGFFDEKGQEIPYGKTSDQDHTPWTLGSDNYFILTAAGKTTLVPVTIIEYPVESIEFNLASPIIIYENLDGYYYIEGVGRLYMDENGYYYYDYSKEEPEKIYAEPEGFRYNQLPVYKNGNQLIIHNKDGSTKTLTQRFVFTEEDHGYFFVDENGNYDNNVSFNWDDQIETPFMIGSDNHITVKYMDTVTTIPVTVIENNIESIEYHPVVPIVYNIDDPKDVYTGAEYGAVLSIFNPQKIRESGSILTAHFKDGTTKRYTMYTTSSVVDGKYNPVIGPRYWAVDEEGSVIGYSSLLFDYDTTDWTAGNTYYITVSYLGKSTKVPVKVIDGNDNTYILGDADGNGDIEAVDVTFVQRFAADIPTPYEESQLMHADVDGDGEITVMDATAIQYYLAQMKTDYAIGKAVS